MTLANQRREYLHGRLTRESLADSPFEQFKIWLNDAINAGLRDPTAMSVATVDSEGRPWQRLVLLKQFDDKGFVFFTNLGSRKAQHIAHNNKVALLFPWNEIDRQVIVGGLAEKVSKTAVAKYFLSRPRESQLAAIVSRQSNRLSSRQALEAQFTQLKEKFLNRELPVPDFWGGFRVIPDEFQFWQGGEHRLHDRFQYLLNDQGAWETHRLAP